MMAWTRAVHTQRTGPSLQTPVTTYQQEGLP